MPMPVSAHVHTYADEENASCCHEAEKVVIRQNNPYLVNVIGQWPLIDAETSCHDDRPSLPPPPPQTDHLAMRRMNAPTFPARHRRRGPLADEDVPAFCKADFDGMLGDAGRSRNKVRLGAPQRECRAPFILTVRHMDDRVGVYASEHCHAQGSFVAVYGDCDFEFTYVLSSRACALGACQLADGAVRGPATQSEEEAALFAYQQQQLCLKYAQGLSAAGLREASRMHFTSCRFTLNCKTLFVHFTSPHVVQPQGCAPCDLQLLLAGAARAHAWLSRVDVPSRHSQCRENGGGVACPARFVTKKSHHSQLPRSIKLPSSTFLENVFGGRLACWVSVVFPFPPAPRHLLPPL